MDGLIILTFVFIGFCIWFFIANELTLRKRLNLIPRPEDPLFEEKMKAHHEVSYNDHLWSVITFRNPMKLYARKDLE